MGTLGQYLKSAREAKEIDLRDAAQQTRISANYLKALEEEDFAKLPGEVFVRGFLKNYARFLNLEQAEALRRYSELTSQKPIPAVDKSPSSPAVVPEKAAPDAASPPSRETSLELFVWGAIICIALLAFLFSSLPMRHAKRQQEQEQQQETGVISALPGDPALAPPERPEKLYLEVIALEDTWLLIRTDTSPQKKAVLKKGESLIWSADDRFLVSYGRVGDVKLLLNGEEVPVKAAGETPVRDLAVTRSGIVNQPVAAKPPQPIARKPKPPVESAQTSTVPPRPRPVPASAPAETATAAPAKSTAASTPAPAPAVPDASSAPAQASPAE